MSQKSAHTELSLPRRKSRCLITLLAWIGILEFVRGMSSVNWEMLFLGIETVVFLGFLIQWTRLDAEEHDCHIWPSFVPLLVTCVGPFIMMPIYFIKSRGWKKGLITSLLALGYVVLLVGTSVGAYSVSYVIFH